MASGMSAAAPETAAFNTQDIHIHASPFQFCTARGAHTRAGKHAHVCCVPIERMGEGSRGECKTIRNEKE